MLPSLGEMTVAAAELLLEKQPEKYAQLTKTKETNPETGKEEYPLERYARNAAKSALEAYQTEEKYEKNPNNLPLIADRIKHQFLDPDGM